MTAATMTKAEFARHRGVSPPAVSKWVKRGQIVLTKDGRVHVAKSEKKLGKLVDPGRGRVPVAAQGVVSTEPATPAPSASDALATIRARDLHERSIGQALKNAQLAGELVPIAAYEARLQTLVAGFCDRFSAELRALAERLALETDARTIRALLEDAVYAVRTDMAQRAVADQRDED